MSVPEERSGHIGVKFRHYVLIWGGHNSNRFMDRKAVWFYDMKTKKWERKEATGKVPPCTSGSCAALIDTCLYFFGGFSYRGCLHNVYMLDVNTLRWKKIGIKSRKPSPRDKLGCWVRDSKLIFFGGYGINPTNDNLQSGVFVHDESSRNGRGGWNNDLLSFDIVAGEWEALPLSNATPSPRAAHACTNVTCDIGYLFGGRHRDRRLNDLYSINLNSFVWTRIEVHGPAPEGRTWHSLISIDRNHLFAFGGLNTQADTLADTWIYNTAKDVWTEVEHEKKVMRRWHSTCRGLFPGQIIVFGGCRSVEGTDLDGTHVNELHVFQLAPLPLRKIALNAVVKFGEKCGSFSELPLRLQEDISEMLSGG